MLHRPIVTAAIAAILAMQVPAQPIAAMMATTPSQLREATTADNLELAAWHHHHHWHRHYWHWYFPRFWLMGLALAPSPASPPPGTAGDRDSSQQARRTGNRGAVATQSASS